MVLEPGKVRLVRDDDGLEIVVDGVSRRVGRIARAFPKTNPDRYLGFMDPDGHEIGMVENPDEMDTESCDLLNAELKEIYFVPTILEIRSVESKGTGSLWNVLADDGERTFRIQSRDALDGSAPPSIAVTDENGKHYFIEDYWALEPESRQTIAELLPDKVIKARSGRMSMGRRGGGFSRGGGPGGGNSSGGMMRF